MRSSISFHGKSHSKTGFSLIEVALSIAIVGFGLVALLGLMSVALGTVRDTTDDNRVAIIARHLIADRGGTAFYLTTTSNIPRLDAPASFIPPSSPTNIYFTKDGQVTNNPTSFTHPAFYRANITLTEIPPGAVKMDIRMEWPVWPANNTITNKSYFSTMLPNITP